MTLERIKLVLVIIGLIGILLIATPAISSIVNPPTDDQFSELYLLGPGHMVQDYPTNVTSGQNYSLYVGVKNHMGASTYYTLYVKLLNKTDALPNTGNTEYSSVQPLIEYKFSIPNNEDWDRKLTFSINKLSVDNNKITISELQINNLVLEPNKSTDRNSANRSYDYLLLFELWVYHPESNTVQFDNRFVDLQFNVTKTD